MNSTSAVSQLHISSACGPQYYVRQREGILQPSLKDSEGFPPRILIRFPIIIETLGRDPLPYQLIHCARPTTAWDSRSADQDFSASLGVQLSFGRRGRGWYGHFKLELEVDS